jgi:hypothetical protein
MKGSKKLLWFTSKHIPKYQQHLQEIFHCHKNTQNTLLLEVNCFLLQVKLLILNTTGQKYSTHINIIQHEKQTPVLVHLKI